jgi:hypothetical protein
MLTIEIDDICFPIQATNFDELLRMAGDNVDEDEYRLKLGG